jgi:hypothetical protein
MLIKVPFPLALSSFVNEARNRHFQSYMGLGITPSVFFVGLWHDFLINDSHLPPLTFLLLPPSHPLVFPSLLSSPLLSSLSEEGLGQ